MRRTIPLRPRTETYPTPALEPIAKATRKSSVQMLRSPHLMNFRITDNVETNNIFTEDRSALKVKTNTNILTRSGPAPLEPSSIHILNKSKSREFDANEHSSSEESSACPTIDELMVDIVSKDHSLGFIDNFIGKHGHAKDPTALLLRLTDLYTAVTRPPHRVKKMTASPGIVQFRIINLLKRLLDLVDEDDEWLQRLSDFVTTLEAGDEVDHNRAQYFRQKIDDINAVHSKITNIRAAREMRSHFAPGKSDVGEALSPKKSKGRDKPTGEDYTTALTLEAPAIVQSTSKTDVRSTSPKKEHDLHAKNKDQIKAERKIQKLQEQKISLRDSGEKESSKEKKFIKLDKKLAQYKKKCDQMKD